MRDARTPQGLPAYSESGCNILELQSRSGHLTLSELQKYIDKADKRFAADHRTQSETKNWTQNRGLNV
jgi:hypothetical protein